MPGEKNREIKFRLHPRNRNRERYDLQALIKARPALKEHVKPNRYGDDSVDFSNPAAVKLLNSALLCHYYGIQYWEFPDENLCPPIPGRADYIHQMAGVLSENNFGNIPTGDQITCLDIGVGASCIYPILGVVEYGWNFIGSDIDPRSIETANKIVAENTALQGKVDCRLQPDAKDILYGIIQRQDYVDLAICNPPFHASAEDAEAGAQRKVKNLTGQKSGKPALNFSGISQELIYDGGESKFIHSMIRESEKFSKNCLWFSTLVSKQSNLKGIHKALEQFRGAQVRTIPMGTGNKSTRIVAWSFLGKEDRKAWRESRWTQPAVTPPST